MWKPSSLRIILGRPQWGFLGLCLLGFSLFKFIFTYPCPLFHPLEATLLQKFDLLGNSLMSAIAKVKRAEAVESFYINLLILIFWYLRHFDFNSTYTKFQYLSKETGLHLHIYVLVIHCVFWRELPASDGSEVGIMRAVSGMSLLARSRGKLS